jgi:hypothetical protein
MADPPPLRMGSAAAVIRPLVILGQLLDLSEITILLAELKILRISLLNRHRYDAS